MRPIIMCGVPRSGSTLVGQILQAVFPRQEIIQTHPDEWESDGFLTVVSIRNPHDVVASLYRVRLSRGKFEEGTMNDLENVIKRMEMYFRGLKPILKGPHLLFRYENFFDDYSVIYNGICNVFNIEIPPCIRRQISERFSLEANRTRAAKLKDFNDVDENGIHGDHIGAVVPGHWRNTLPKWALSRVKEVCGPIARKWDYED